MSVLVVWQLILLLIIWTADPARIAVKQFNEIWNNLDDPKFLSDIHKVEKLVRFFPK